MEFTVDLTNESGKKVLLIGGNLDEDASFPEIELGREEVEVDMKNVQSVNSVGIRSWLQWIGPLSETTRFVFRDCSKSVVLQMNMVKGFLPKSGAVQSLQVPFYSESRDQEKDVLFVVGRDVSFRDGEISIHFDTQKLGEGDWEIDVNVNKYFRFLKPD